MNRLYALFGLSIEERAAIFTIRELSRERGCIPVPDDAAYIVSWLGCSTRLWNKIRTGLLAKGKLETVDHYGQASLRLCDDLAPVQTEAELSDAERRSRPARARETADSRSTRAPLDADSSSARARENAEAETKPNENNDSPRAHVGARGIDIPLRLVTTGGTDVDDARASDDWPDPGKRKQFELLIEAVASPVLDAQKSPDLVTTSGRLRAWKRDGASWHSDVLPVVSGLCAKSRKPIVSWKYFDAAIAQSIADNRAALEIPDASVPRRSTGPPMSFSERANEAQAIAVRRILEAGE